MNGTSKKYDIIVVGATGFTGRLVAEYLFETYGCSGEVKWALAGRSAEKLHILKSELVQEKKGHSLDVIICDTLDVVSVQSLVVQTRVICSTVGPYGLYGSTLVEICAKEGTDYCDLTGEVQWMQKMIGAHQKLAEASGARIVHACGFDSIPSDMGVFYCQQKMKEMHNVVSNSISCRIKKFKGGYSGGTIASMVAMLDEVSGDKRLLRKVADAYALIPEGSHRGNDTWDQTKAVYDRNFNCWTVPFVMAGVNMRVVRRSNALLDFLYGKDFCYNESLLLSARVGKLKAGLVAFSSGLSMKALTIKPLRSLILRNMPAPGEGPSKQRRETGFYNMLFHAAHPTDNSKSFVAELYGDRDPGYGSTSKMLGESAVCLAKDQLNCGGGLWTPSSAMGSSLLQRLQKYAGLHFSIVSKETI